MRQDTQLLSEFKLNKPEYVKTSELTNVSNTLKIPVSINEDSIGKPLDTIVSNNIITNIKLNFKNKEINFLDNIKNKTRFLSDKHSNKITIFDSSFKFYKLRDKYHFILAVKVTDSHIEKIRYSLDGVVINRVIDNKTNN